jgi:NDP-sugar pyrophosphorylase family protein
MLIPYPNQYGIVKFSDDGLVSSFAEKPDLPHWINGGVYVFDRSIETLLPEIGDHETETFPALARQKKLAALTSSAFWTSVESAKELRDVGERFASRGL